LKAARERWHKILFFVGCFRSCTFPQEPVFPFRPVSSRPYNQTYLLQSIDDARNLMSQTPTCHCTMPPTRSSADCTHWPTECHFFSITHCKGCWCFRAKSITCVTFVSATSYV